LSRVTNSTAMTDGDTYHCPPLQVPDNIMLSGKKRSAQWYWEQIYGEWFDSYSETAYRNFVRVAVTLVERVVKNWSNTVYSNCQGAVRSAGGEVSFEGSAEDMINFLEKVSYADVMRFSRVYVVASRTAEPADKEEIQKINDLIEMQRQRLHRAVQFDLYRRCEDAYNGNVDALADRDRDTNFQGVLRPDSEHVESIVPHDDGHYLIVRSCVIVVDSKATPHPAPMRATALHFAVISDKASVVKYLLSKGAKRNIKADCGATPMEIAIANKCKKALAVLDPSHGPITYSPRALHSPHRGSPPGSPGKGDGMQVEGQEREYNREMAKRRSPPPF